MSISIQDALGVHSKALLIQSRRAELLASNLANADTPGYKARDIDFQAALAEVSEGSGVAERQPHSGHIPLNEDVGGAKILYRVPTQPALDGNTVETQVEQGVFAENAMRYQASLRFLDGTIKTLLTAVRGD